MSWWDENEEKGGQIVGPAILQRLRGELEDEEEIVGHILQIVFRIGGEQGRNLGREGKRDWYKTEGENYVLPSHNELKP